MAVLRLSVNPIKTLLLTKNEHFGANCVWDVSRLNSENYIQPYGGRVGENAGNEVGQQTDKVT